MNIARRAAVWGVAATVGVALAGCGVSSALGGHHAPARAAGWHHARPTYRVLTADGISMRVPGTWRLGRQVTVSKIAATGLDAAFLIPQVPKDVAALTHDPENQDAYFTETVQDAAGTAYGTIDELSAAGDYYQIQLTVPASVERTLRQALASARLPPVATVSEAVRLIEHRATVGTPLWLANTGAGNTSWLLVGGAVATAQQPFYLFRTIGGQHWTLINYTAAPPHVFPDVAGRPGMLFWSPTDGIIAEVVGWSRDLWIYETSNGGETWTPKTMILPSEPNAAATPNPEVTWKPSGTLAIAVVLKSGVSYSLTSYNSGRTWTP